MWATGWLLLFSLLPVVLPAGTAHAAARPNVVLVIGDDHGWPDAGFMGHPFVATPVLDRLAAEGTVFTNAHLPASVCRPSHQTLLSGLHPEQWSAKRTALAAATPLPYRQEVVHYRTLPRELARRGYTSWEGGKMHEGTFAQAGFDSGLARRKPLGVFDVDGEGFGRSGWDAARCGTSRVLDEPCPAMEPLRDFLDRNGDRPFFLWIAPVLPHTPFDPPIQFLLPYVVPGLSLDEILYYAQITRLDAVVGEVLRELDARRLGDDTLLVYVSDNGWEIGQGFFADFGHGKRSLHELGTRTPLVFRWPGRVPGGVVRDDLVSSEDLVPTILDYAGAEPLPDRRGRSLKRAIESGEPFERRDYVSLLRNLTDADSGSYVRTPRWRYLQFVDGHEELYDIAEDPFETRDVADSRSDLLPGFRDRVAAWQHEILTPPPRLEITGRLVAEAGSPIPGASLELHSEAETLEVLTDRDGGFRFQSLPHGVYQLAAGPGLEGLAAPVAVSLPVGPVGSHLPRVVALPSLPLRAAGAARISGRLWTSDHEPLADARVTLQRRRGRAETTVVVKTDATGRYLAENLPAGLYWIRAEAGAGWRVHPAVVGVGSRSQRIRDLIARATGPNCRRIGPRRARECWKRSRSSAWAPTARQRWPVGTQIRSLSPT